MIDLSNVGIQATIRMICRISEHIQNFLSEKERNAAQLNKNLTDRYDESEYEFPPVFSWSFHSKKHQGKRLWGFVPSDLHKLTEAIYLINRSGLTEDSLIVDAGCGFSPLLMFLKTQNFKNLVGIEYQHELAKLFESTFNMNSLGILHHKCIEGDMINPNDEILDVYSKADFIYTYMPIQDEKLYKQSVRNIADAAKSGCMLHETYCFSLVDNVLSQNPQWECKWDERAYVKK